jgi:hypothetical protein
MMAETINGIIRNSITFITLLLHTHTHTHTYITDNSASNLVSLLFEKVAGKTVEVLHQLQTMNE